MRFLIGIDDTDNKESRGTGFKARELARLIEKNKIGRVTGVTRHQLYVHDEIAYTSQNSSACLEVFTKKEKELKLFCASYLKSEAAEGSDAGLCISGLDVVSKEIQQWGRRAKKEVLKLNEACKIAEKENIYLEGFTGDLIGQIGALAAVGLRKQGNDGRFIWLKGNKECRNLRAGLYDLDLLKSFMGIENFISENGLPIKENCRILCGEWVRPVLIDNKPTLVLCKVNNTYYDWETASKDYIRAIS